MRSLCVLYLKIWSPCFLHAVLSCIKRPSGRDYCNCRTICIRPMLTSLPTSWKLQLAARLKQLIRHTLHGKPAFKFVVWIPVGDGVIWLSTGIVNFEWITYLSYLQVCEKRRSSGSFHDNGRAWNLWGSGKIRYRICCQKRQKWRLTYHHQTILRLIL